MMARHDGLGMMGSNGATAFFSASYSDACVRMVRSAL